MMLAIDTGNTTTCNISIRYHVRKFASRQMQRSVTKKGSCCVSTIIGMVLLVAQTVSWADTLQLKNGQTVKGRIVERKTDHIMIQLERGGTVPYWLDEIEQIQEEEEPEVQAPAPSMGTPAAQTKTADTKDVGQSGPQTSDAERYFEVGTKELFIGNWQAAEQAFARALAAAPHHTGARFNRGCALALAGRLNDAREEFRAALTTAQPFLPAFCYFNLAGLDAKEAMTRKDGTLFTSAARQFQKAAQALPNFILALDYAQHSQMFSQLVESTDSLQYSMAELAMPDSGRFLSGKHIFQTGRERTYFFDRDGPPMLYFYQSPSCQFLICMAEFDLQNPTRVPPKAPACLKHVVGMVRAQPPHRLHQLLEENALQILSVLEQRQRQ